jgi:hypothetical protein
MRVTVYHQIYPFKTSELSAARFRPIDSARSDHMSPTDVLSLSRDRRFRRRGILPPVTTGLWCHLAMSKDWRRPSTLHGHFSQSSDQVQHPHICLQAGPTVLVFATLTGHVILEESDRDAAEVGLCDRSRNDARFSRFSNSPHGVRNATLRSCPSLNLREAVPNVRPLGSAEFGSAARDLLCDSGTINGTEMLYSAVANPSFLPEVIPLKPFVSNCWIIRAFSESA